jgi:hypothetical protein
VCISNALKWPVVATEILKGNEVREAMEGADKGG